MVCLKWTDKYHENEAMCVGQTKSLALDQCPQNIIKPTELKNGMNCMFSLTANDRQRTKEYRIEHHII